MNRFPIFTAVLGLSLFSVGAYARDWRTNDGQGAFFGDAHGDGWAAQC